MANKASVYERRLEPNLKFDYVPIKEVNIGGTSQQKDWLRTETFLDTVSRLLKESDVQKAGGFMVIRPKNYKGAEPFLYPKDHNHDHYHPKHYDMNHTMNVFGVQNLKTYFKAQIHDQQCKQVESQIFKWQKKDIYQSNKTVQQQFQLNQSKTGKNTTRNNKRKKKKTNSDKHKTDLPFEVIVDTNGEQITQTQSGRIVKVYSQNQDFYAELDRYLEHEHDEEEDSEDIDVNQRKRKRNDNDHEYVNEISPTKKRKLLHDETQTVTEDNTRPQIQIHSDGVFTIDYKPNDIKYQYPFQLTATMPEPDEHQHDVDEFKLETRTPYIYKEKNKMKSNYCYDPCTRYTNDRDQNIKMPSPSLSQSPSRSLSPTRKKPMHINRGFACVIEQIEKKTKKRVETFWDKDAFETQLKSNVYLGATPEQIPLIFCDYLKSAEKVQYAIVDEETTYHFESPLQLNQLSRYGPFSVLAQNEVMLGIQLPYVYIGQQHAFFPFHREDMNLFAANHLLWGCNKLWYCIHPTDHEKVLQFVRQQYCTEDDRLKHCETPLQHKLFWFDPYILLCMGIKVFFIRQQPGDIVITPPGGIHGGLNAGPNMAESINFMTYDIEMCWKPVLSAMLFYCHNYQCDVCITHAFLDINRLAMRLRNKEGEEYKDKVPDASVIYDALPITTSFRNIPKYKNADKYISRSFTWNERLSLKSRYLHSNEYKAFTTALTTDIVYPYYVKEDARKVIIYPVQYNGTFQHRLDTLLFEPMYSISYLNHKQKENEHVPLKYILTECGIKHGQWNEAFDENAVRFQLQNRFQLHNIHTVFCYESQTNIKDDSMNSVERRKIKSKRVIADSDTESDDD